MKNFFYLASFCHLYATVFCASCKLNPSQLQCLAVNNRFLTPRNSHCDPFKKKCRMGDLIKTSIAACELRPATHLRHSLTSSYKISPKMRCQPEFESKRDLYKRVVAMGIGDPTCMPVELKRKGSFTCGEKGTQSNKKCSRGINQCTTNPSVCLDENKECIELHDELPSWNMEGGKHDEGYACVDVEDIKYLSRSTNFCTLKGKIANSTKNALNYVDTCCRNQLKCNKNNAKDVQGNIMSHRPCHCNVEFRKCLRRYVTISVYKDLANTVLRAINQLKNCEIRDGSACNPSKPKTCRKGDLIDPKYAHCKVNCRTGPLLPIGQRMCRIRQCKPPNYVEGVRIIDIPNHRTSSICQPVRRLRYLCGKGDTRCVCDGKPRGEIFTDRCRCQFWPLKV
ncbi:uncharacterized protein LOC124453479 [Xenia sp. Carnegie-2017]|uniref:uncharacterized protein LOC124453479 n=1 Tax=Xenia sp. Carnegie-2017 TaxID=2897299 RepID=UPI001F041FA1|nr:uncharacterized protein LOC124453479 [Xenia sp. Carnegie-2017]